jgi:hypothetical protein
MQTKKYIVQFNEANFDLIKKYCSKYYLPNLNKILDLNSTNTSSESEYHLLEPWIQWYSFYTNLPFSEHKTFNLGDCLKNSHKNFLEDYAVKGNKVGVFGAMNLRNSAHFKLYLPDPWTETHTNGGFGFDLVSFALNQIVNENAKLKLSFKSLAGLILLIGLPTDFLHLKMIFSSLISFIKKDRAKLAALFDYFIATYALRKSKKNNLDMTIFFMNGLAHIQHHYFLNSEFVDGTNPKWYCDNKDYFFEALKIYDLVFKKVFKTIDNNNGDLWTITGLTQESYANPFCYWRFVNHKNLLKNFLNTQFDVYPRMTRDFEIHVNKKEDIELVRDFLENAIIKELDGETTLAFINVDQTSEKSIFASFAYSGQNKDVNLFFNNIEHNLEDEIIFVALKNAGHDQRGWAFTNKKVELREKNIPIWKLSNHII